MGTESASHGSAGLVFRLSAPSPCLPHVSTPPKTTQSAGLSEQLPFVQGHEVWERLHAGAVCIQREKVGAVGWAGLDWAVRAPKAGSGVAGPHTTCAPLPRPLADGAGKVGTQAGEGGLHPREDDSTTWVWGLSPEVHGPDVGSCCVVLCGTRCFVQLCFVVCASPDALRSLLGSTVCCKDDRRHF